MLTALLLSIAAVAPQSVTEIQSRVPGTREVLSLDLAEWTEDREIAAPMREMLGDKLLMVGSVGPGGATLSVVVESNEPLASPKAWRERLAPPGEVFELRSASCVDSSSEVLPGMQQSDFHGYFATRTHVYDVHVSKLHETDDEPFPRKEFERIVDSLRLRLLRRGWAEDYPREIAAPMTLASVLGVESEAWTRKYLPEHSGEWAAHFANAEHLRPTKATTKQKLAAYDKALELLAKVEEPGVKERFATAILYEGKNLVHYEAKDYKASIAPMEKGLAIVTELGRPERAGFAYNLACSNALLKRRRPAVDALAIAIEVDPRYRGSAARDSDFAALRDYRPFQKLLEEPDSED